MAFRQTSNALWDLLNQDSKSKVKLDVWAVQEEQAAWKLRDCKNVQEYASMIQANVKQLNLCAESLTGTMPKS
jgi:hypothetical protein